MQQTKYSKIDVSTPVVVISGDLHGHAVARSLGRLGINVYGVHIRNNSPAAKSKYWRDNFVWNVYKKTEEESLKWFQDLSNKFEQTPILIATNDDSQLFIDDNAKQLKDFFLFYNRPFGLARTLSNKKLLYHLCKENFITTPETIFPESLTDIEDFNKRATFPVMLKGIDTEALSARFGVRMIIVNDRETLLSLFKKMHTPENLNLMIQEYIAGDAQNDWMFDGYFNSNSDCLFWMTGKKIRQNPVYVGMASLGICESNEILFNEVKDFMKTINYRGIIDIDFRFNSVNGKYYLLDPNPRLGRTFRLFVDSEGLDVVRVLYLDLTGQEVKIGNFLEGRKWIDEYLDIDSSWIYWRDGNLKFKQWLISFKKVKEAQWFAIDDLKPFLSICLIFLRRFIKKIAKVIISFAFNKNN